MSEKRIREAVPTNAKARRSAGFCIGGAGGIRTLVQTTATRAFYMLSRLVGFRSAPGKWHPNVDLDPVLSSTLRITVLTSLPS